MSPTPELVKPERGDVDAIDRDRSSLSKYQITTHATTQAHNANRHGPCKEQGEQERTKRQIAHRGSVI